MTTDSGDADLRAARWLLGSAAVRTRASALLARLEAGQSRYFVYRPARFEATLDAVQATIRANYPDLAIPFHSRWRHFESGGVDRWARLADTLDADAGERARIRFDLAIVSVLLDAGAGPLWSYRGADGKRYARSEGLGVASFEMFCAGAFSAHPGLPLRCDAQALLALDVPTLARGMQVDGANPLEGLAGRVELLRSLGRAMRDDMPHFGSPARIGGLFDALLAGATGGSIGAARVLEVVLAALGPIWPGRHVLAGLPLGDAWPHSAFASDDIGHGYVPLHKLSQWLTYSLIEPLEEAGLAVTDLDGLTGLAEYRNGGLMLDAGLIEWADPRLAEGRHAPSSELVVEWRSLTVALLDRIAAGLRERLDMDAKSLPLARVLEGGTWAAGRRLARERRADGGPPFAIASDGTLF